MKTIRTLLFTSISLLMLAGCSGETVPNTKGVYMLIDTSGTYTKELKQAQKVINFVLATLNPGDTFAVASVDTGSFSEKDIKAKVTFDDRPSMTNRQKREFRDKIDKYVKSVKGSSYTDITGGMLQAIEYLNEADAGYVRDIPLQLGGYSVVALNVTKLRSDNIDPREYLDRLADWEKKVQSGGGQWRVVNDLARLEGIFATR